MARQMPANNPYDQDDEDDYVPKTGRPHDRYSLARSDPRGTMQSRSHSNTNPHPAGNNNNPSARRRITVACGRCRKRKIRCSGDTDGLGCTNCRGASIQPGGCMFLRAGSNAMELHPYVAATASASAPSLVTNQYDSVPGQSIRPSHSTTSLHASFHNGINDMIPPKPLYHVNNGQEGRNGHIFGSTSALGIESDGSSSVYDGNYPQYMLPDVGAGMHQDHWRTIDAITLPTIQGYSRSQTALNDVSLAYNAMPSQCKGYSWAAEPSLNAPAAPVYTFSIPSRSRPFTASSSLCSRESGSRSSPPLSLPISTLASQSTIPMTRIGSNYPAMYSSSYASQAHLPFSLTSANSSLLRSHSSTVLNSPTMATSAPSLEGDKRVNGEVSKGPSSDSASSSVPASPYSCSPTSSLYGTSRSQPATPIPTRSSSDKESELCDCGDYVKDDSLLGEDQIKMQISYTLGGAPYYEQANIDWTWDDVDK